MEQQSVTEVPTTPHQVIYIIEAPKEKVNIKEAYNNKAATVLGVIHIICGLIALGADIGHMFNTPMTIGSGFWTPVFFFISGGLAIGGARNGNKCLVVATMVMAIISAIFAGVLLITSAFALDFHSYSNYYYSSYSNYYRDGIAPLRCTLLVLLIATGATMLVIAIASASLTCKPLCYRSNKQGAVHYQPNQVPASVLINADQNAALNLPDVQHLQTQPSPSVQLLAGSAEPPAYRDVGGVGSSYQKF